MKRIVILGAGGLGRQALAQLQMDCAHGIDWLIAGFIDERGVHTVPAALYYPWLGDPASFVPDPDHLFVAAVGDPLIRERQVSALLAKGAEFISVRTRCTIGTRSIYGATYFGYDVSCGVDCTIGSFSFIDQGSLIGHDVVIGDYVHIAPRCVLAGNVTVGDGAVINSGALIARGINIGAGAVVGLGAVVFHDVAPGQTVVGNPARSIFTKSQVRP